MLVLYEPRAFRTDTTGARKPILAKRWDSFYKALRWYVVAPPWTGKLSGQEAALIRAALPLCAYWNTQLREKELEEHKARQAKRSDAV